MEIIESKSGNFTIVELNGRLDTTNYSQVEKKLLEMVEKGENKILVDFKNLEYISSSGLRVLLMILKKVTSLKGAFPLCSLNDNIKQIFDISGFTNIFTIYSNREEALKSIQ
jgi:anti-sigma B factor antagonist